MAVGKKNHTYFEDQSICTLWWVVWDWEKHFSFCLSLNDIIMSSYQWQHKISTLSNYSQYFLLLNKYFQVKTWSFIILKNYSRSKLNDSDFTWREAILKTGYFYCNLKFMIGKEVFFSILNPWAKSIMLITYHKHCKRYSNTGSLQFDILIYMHYSARKIKWNSWFRIWNT